MKFVRHQGPRPLAELVGSLVAPACRRRGVANAALMIDPADVFGERFARSAAIDRIVWPAQGAEAAGATLVVRADGAAALALQHVAPQIIERVNVIIGWPAIGRLRLTQAGGRACRPPSALAARAVPVPPADPAGLAAVAARLGDVGHSDLKDALSRLGARVAERGLTSGGKRP